MKVHPEIQEWDCFSCIIKGYKCIFVTNDKQSKEKCDILRAVGAEVIVCPTDVPPKVKILLFCSKRLAQETPNGWYVNQYDNPSNRQAHYESTAPEIWQQLKTYSFCCRSRYRWNCYGCGTFFKEKNPDIQIIGIDTYGSILKHFHETGEIDKSLIHTYITEGIGEDIIPENYDMSVIDHFEKVTDKDGAIYARKLALEEGIFCGYSAGSAIAALVQMKTALQKMM